MSNMSAIDTMTARSRDCGQDRVTCVCCVVICIVQYRVYLHCHGSVGSLIAACIIVCWNDKDTHIRHVWVSICTHWRMTEFSDVVLFWDHNELWL